MTASDASAQAGPTHIQFARSMTRKRFVLSSTITPGEPDGEVCRHRWIMGELVDMAMRSVGSSICC